MMKGLIDKLLSRSNETLTYEKARELAAHEDVEVRAELASREDVRPEILYFLAEDPSPRVRRVIAENPATPHHADLILARDDDHGVRGGLAEKISRLVPDMDVGERDKIEKMAFDALEVLTRDQETRVRQILAETLKDVANAPPDVIRRLAFDTEIIVAGPVLEYSPVLSDTDLLEIIEHGTARGRLNCISQRAQIGETLSDAIAATGDEKAVALLLANESAQIREETLDSIIEQAREVESWHAPLVARPKLSDKAALRLARFVAANLIEVLAARQDLAPDVLDEVKRVVDARIDAGDEGFTEAREDEAQEDSTTPLEEAFETARVLHAEGRLTPARVEQMLDASQKEPALGALAVLAELSVAAVQKAIHSKNQKGLVAIAWKAGLSAKSAEKVQGTLLGLPTDQILRADGDSYPMSDDDMEWQFEFVADLA